MIEGRAWVEPGTLFVPLSEGRAEVSSIAVGITATGPAGTGLCDGWKIPGTVLLLLQNLCLICPLEDRPSATLVCTRRSFSTNSALAWCHHTRLASLQARVPVRDLVVVGVVVVVVPDFVVALVRGLPLAR